MSKKTEAVQGKSYDKLIRAMQIAAGVFMLAMIIAFIVLIRKYDISIKNLDTVAQCFTGGVFTLALIIILLNLVKSFALVVSPSYVFILSGLIFEDVKVAILVNFIAVEIGMILPYYLGRFTGKGMVDTLRNRFPKVKKIDDFAGENGFVISLVLKAAGLIPGDISSLVLGAMDINFRSFYLGATIGTLPLNIMWAILANKGDLSNPYTLLYLLPIVAFVILMSVIVKKMTNRKKSAEGENDSAEE